VVRKNKGDFAVRMGTFQMPDPQLWTRWDEIKQRAGNVRRMLMFAWLAATNDSAVFAVVMFNSCRSAGDGLMGAVMMDGRRIDPEGIMQDDKLE
jgi:hypothetical protein